MPFVEEIVGVARFNKNNYECFKDALPEMHPDCVRVTKIFNDVVEALRQGLMKHKGPKCSGLAELHFGSLEGLEWDWEVLVVKDDDAAFAFCLPGGKLVLFTGLLDRFNTDDEIANLISHELAHVMARHVAENYTKNYFRRFIVLFFFFGSSGYDAYDFTLNLPFSLRMDIAADYIGLLLMASAGYDPRVAPKVLEKLDQISEDLVLDGYPSFEPMGKARSKSLSEGSVMQEAISMYEEAKAGADRS